MSRTDRPPGTRISYRRQYRRCGKASCTRCAAGQPGHGPYWYAFWSDGGRRRSRYLGLQAPAGVETDTGDAARTLAPSSPVPVTPAIVVTPAIPTIPAIPATPVTSTPAARGVPPASPAPAPAVLRVRTLGGFAVWRGAVPLPPARWTNRRAASLFKCLLGAPGHRLHREQVIELLWPEVAPETGAANLRTTLHRLRQVLAGPDGLEAAPACATYVRTEGDVVALAPSGTAEPPADADWLDATAFARRAQEALRSQEPAACRAALALYGGGYLPDDRYAPWAAPVRETLHRQYLDLLLHLATLDAAHGALEEAEEGLRQVLTLEPSHEDAVATLMGLLAASGRRRAALRVYQALATALEDELDVAPSAELQALRVRLLAQEAARAATTLPLQAPPAQPAPPTNLPAPLTSFVGREWELREVQNALRRARLVTLTGPGGCGKTRLALEVAARALEEGSYPDGVWLVELAALADPALVPQAVAAALGVTEQPEHPLLRTLVAVLQPRHLLLLLDNCEHLSAACAELVTTLLQACPAVRVLATSRAGLGSPGEQPYRVPSLTVPDPAQLPPPAQLLSYEAVALFLERAQVRAPELAPSAAMARSVAEICVRLDGLPLAIELAAARVSLLPVATIAARLDDRFRLLTTGPRTALPRQQSLRATMDWSYELLSGPERTLLQRLAVFVGGWTVDAAEAVCAGAEVAAEAVLELLSGLVHKSLVQRDGEARYRLLETVRVYALERLVASGEAAAVRRVHAAYYVRLAEEAEPQVAGPQQGAWLDRLEREHDNLRAALAWTREAGEADLGLRLAGTLGRFWERRAYFNEGRVWLETLLGAMKQGAPALVVAMARDALSRLAYRQRDYAFAVASAEESLAYYRRCDNARGVAAALNVLANVASDLGDDNRAVALYEESLALRRRAGDRWGVAAALTNLGSVETDRGNDARGAALLEEALCVLRDLGDNRVTAMALNNLGDLARARGNYEQASALHQESLALCVELGDKMNLSYCLEMLAEIAHVSGQPARAARLLGAVHALVAPIAIPMVAPSARAAYERRAATVRAALGAAAFEAAWATGRALPLEQVITDARALDTTGTRPAHRADGARETRKRSRP